MGANLVGSVVAGLLAIVLGTALARGLSADRPAATGSPGGQAMATRVIYPAELGHTRPLSAGGNRPRAIGSRSGVDEERPR
jgi:hypothetical protein